MYERHWAFVTVFPFALVGVLAVATVAWPDPTAAMPFLVAVAVAPLATAGVVYGRLFERLGLTRPGRDHAILVMTALVVAVLGGLVGTLVLPPGYEAVAAGGAVVLGFVVGSLVTARVDPPEAGSVDS